MPGSTGRGLSPLEQQLRKKQGLWGYHTSTSYGYGAAIICSYRYYTHLFKAIPSKPHTTPIMIPTVHLLITGQWVGSSGQSPHCARLFHDFNSYHTYKRSTALYREREIQCTVPHARAICSTIPDTGTLFLEPLWPRMKTVH